MCQQCGTEPGQIVDSPGLKFGPGWAGFLTLRCSNIKQDAAHEPECSHVCSWYRCRNTWICSQAEHFSAIVYLNSLVHISPVTSLQCGLESVECGVWSVK